ncbi:hypothetical protein MNBD_GAMMA14-1093 [hydrothermal vent metagenome]|uniref:NADH:quinone oxidoreductase/Mrp antiporter transmembrane domain-containing protein n=1 Tax=hydrothermal vent metagenome TaxID=652676 RepID=A0A3B0YAQ9_9ZZZZ
MNTTLSLVLLLSVPVLPLLLAFPALHSRVPWPCHLALLPAIILLAVPAVVSVDLPWLLFGTGLYIDGASRLLLGMSVVLWAVAALFMRTPDGQAADNFLTTFCLLTMAGNLGTILANDLVGFFTFSVLMGYGFYGLLVVSGDEATRRAGRAYLGFMILADLALFEALLIAAAMTGDLGFEAVRHATGQSSTSGLYLSMVVVGFAARAGVWPLHFWLLRAFGSARPAVALLLGGVPVAMGLLGMVRWLPLGIITSPKPGLIIQSIGMAAILYATLAGLIRVRSKRLPAYVVIIATGLFVTALGAGLADPVAWIQYENPAYFYIASLGPGLAVLVTGIRWLQARREYAAMSARQEDDSNSWFERLPGAVMRWGREAGLDILPGWRASWLAKAGCLRQIRVWQKTLDSIERYLQRWTFASTLLVLLGVIVALAGASLLR